MESGAKDQDLPGLADTPQAQALAHPLRARIVIESKGGGLSPPQLAAALGEPLARVSYHCRVLEAATALDPPAGR